MLLLPLLRSALRLNKLEGGRLKSEKDPRERELGGGERVDPAGLRSGSSTAGRDTFSPPSGFSFTGGRG